MTTPSRIASIPCQAVPLALVLLGLGCALPSTEPTAAAEQSSEGKSDSLDTGTCLVERDGPEHQDYCLDLSPDDCNTDPECYFQHSIPLYGGSFCAALDSGDCEELGGCDPDLAQLSSCAADDPEPEPAPEPVICQFPRGSDQHIDYCLALPAQGVCDADPACYFQHSIPLYGGSFCAPQDEHGPAMVENAACNDSPQGSPRPQEFGDLIITEIMRDPQVQSEIAGEWFEVFNPTAIEWNLSGCELMDEGSDHHVIGELRIAPESLAVLARSADPGFGPDYVYGGFQLSNGDSDEVVIACNGVEIASVAYDSSWDWSPGRSLELSSDVFAEDLNDQPEVWCSSNASYNGDFGTPHQVDGC
ncbi:MAG: lamin tail domain-containing protein [Deltaproteobacteria bacterium]|nr:lamin tail domain-containing protein [Deltaproteobacteria bacterium]